MILYYEIHTREENVRIFDFIYAQESAKALHKAGTVYSLYSVSRECSCSPLKFKFLDLYGHPPYEDEPDMDDYDWRAEDEAAEAEADLEFQDDLIREAEDREWEENPR
jgi:hypothetical protein